MDPYIFQVDLIFEPSFSSTVAYVNWDCDDPEDILNNMPQDFMEHVLENISIVPLSYETED
jgi:hypothetical protein